MAAKKKTPKSTPITDEEGFSALGETEEKGASEVSNKASVPPGRVEGFNFIVDDTEPHWYIVHTFSGYENKVKTSIEQARVNNDIEDIEEVVIPEHDEEREAEDGCSKVSHHKTFPGYVMLYMKMNSKNWYVVRNIRGCTGFVGPGSVPVPIEEEEVAKMRLDRYTTKAPSRFSIGDKVVISTKNNLFKDYVAIIRAIDEENRLCSVTVEGRNKSIPIEVDFDKLRLFID